jgi:hypothetical protein
VNSGIRAPTRHCGRIRAGAGHQKTALAGTEGGRAKPQQEQAFIWATAAHLWALIA